MPNTFDWVEIRTHDVERTARFFERLFGWTAVQEVAAGGSAYRIVDTGGEPRLENLRRGGMWARPEGAASGVVVYVRVDEIEATLARVVELGGRVVEPKVAQGRAYRAAFADPEGNLFGLWEEREE